MTTSKPKKLSAMDLLVKTEALKPAISQDSVLSRSVVTNLKNGIPVEISPKACRPWKLADRPLAETEHKAELVKSFQSDNVGQLQPVVVRPIKDIDAPEIEYEVICGCVRWMAAKELGIPLRAIVREMNDQEAYAVMSVENRQRQNISDWAKAKSYRRALEEGIFEGAGLLAEAEGISKSKLSLYLGFAELPEAVAGTFRHISNISYRTGYAITRACKVLGAEALITLIPKIEAGEITRDDLERMGTLTVRSSSASDEGQSDPELDDKLAASLNAVPEGGNATAMETNCPSPKEASNHRDSEPLPSDEFSGKEAMSMTSTGSIRNRRESQLKKTYVSSSGLRLFTYNQAARGWLIRIDPEVSMRVDEDLMRDIGNLIEARLSGGDK